jgi:N-acetyltransferase 10
MHINCGSNQQHGSLNSCRYVQRDTLFSGHAAAERMLQALMALYVASHYRNTPNDLAMLADAPAHHLFALLGPVDETKVCS